ncbi:hypothetical protein GQ42DRAFT_46227 [Ramicandelaber brevisporus]|nr:hypothetical protein GQ42DRAFT_46965 [Ramicandelaber brevisporus]KAI8868193.1 hypothetical protein GQ42DRAFT_46227 [Ramicandelaber brevisporus]
MSVTIVSTLFVVLSETSNIHCCHLLRHCYPGHLRRHRRLSLPWPLMIPSCLLASEATIFGINAIQIHLFSPNLSMFNPKAGSTS